MEQQHEAAHHHRKQNCTKTCEHARQDRDARGDVTSATEVRPEQIRRKESRNPVRRELHIGDRKSIKTGKRVTVSLDHGRDRSLTKKTQHETIDKTNIIIS